MAQIKKTRPNRRKRLALRAPSLTQASASGAAGIGKTQSFPVPGEATRFFDGFSRRGALAALALGLLAGVCYLPAMLWGGLNWDDHIWSQSRAVREWSGLSTIWSWPTRIEGEVHYWPLTYTTFWLEHKIWGLAPAGYHIVNVLLHLLNSLLVWRLLLRLAVPGAWVAAAVFAAHPLHVESVAWIIERKDVLSGLFYLTAVLVWLRFLEQPRPWRYGLALLLFAAGLLSKSIVVTLPAALLILQWWKDGRIAVRDLRRLAPFFLVALLITAVDLSSFGSRHGILDYSLPERMLVASRALWFYAGKLVWPADLAVIYPRWDISLGDPWAWLYLAGATALAATLWFMRHRIGRGPLAGALFFAVTLSPVLGFVNYGYMQYSFVADRFQYLAGIGVIAVLIGPPCTAPPAVGQTEVGGDGSCGGGAGASWNDDLAPGGNLPGQGHLLQPHRLSQPQGAERSLQSQQRLDQGRPSGGSPGRRPDCRGKAPGSCRYLCHPQALCLLARNGLSSRPRRSWAAPWRSIRATKKIVITSPRCYGCNRAYEEALEAYRAVIEIDPTYARAHAYMGDVLVRLHRYAEAVESLNKALTLIKAAPSLRPNLPTAGLLHALLGKASWGLGRLQAGDEYFRRALELDPHNMVTIEYVAAAHFRRKRYRQALDLFRTLLEIDPERAATHAHIGATLHFLGRTEEAVRSLERALSPGPNPGNGQNQP